MWRWILDVTGDDLLSSMINYVKRSFSLLEA